MKYLFQVGMAPSRGIAGQVKLAFKVIDPILKQMRSDKLIDLVGTTTWAYEPTSQPGRPLSTTVPPVGVWRVSRP